MKGKDIKRIKLIHLVKEKLPAKEIFTKDALIAGGLVVGAVLWVGFARRVAPKLIRAAVKGESYAPLNDFISQRKPKAPIKARIDHQSNNVISHHPLDFEAYFLSRWNDVAATGLIIWGCFGVLMWRPTRTYFVQHHVGMATPGTLGAMRVFVCLVAAFMVSEEPIEDVASWLAVHRRPMGVMTWFYRIPIIDKVTNDRQTGLKFKRVTIGVLLVGAIGWQSRVVLPLGTILYLIAQGIVRSYTYFNHAGMIPFQILAILSCTRSADRYSLDHLIRVRRGSENQVPNHAQAHYAWARLAVWLVLALPYWKSGMSKLRFGSWGWWRSVNMRAIFFKYRLSWAEIVEDAVPKPLVLLPDSFYDLLGLCTIVTEVGMMLTPLSQRARLILPAGAAGLHLGIWGVMGIEFWDMLFLQAIFYDWGALLERLSTQNESQKGQFVEDVANNPAAVADCRAPLAIFLLTAFHFGWWALRIESYPFSSWQIFHKDSHSGVFKYVKVFKTDESGQRTPAYLWQMGRSSRDHAVLLILHFIRTNDYTYISDVLRQIGARWNTNAKPGERLTELELVEFEWDFVNNRHERKGQPVKDLVVTFPLPEDPPLLLKL